MACPHVSACPLFPLMNASLNQWRSYYCESATGFQGCARYIRSSRGEIVPLGLLPNGRHAQHIQGEADDAQADDARAATMTASSPTHVPAADHGSLETVSSSGWFEQMRRPHRATQAVRPPRPQLTVRPRAAIPEPRKQSRSVAGGKRSWWTRFTDWMQSSI